MIKTEKQKMEKGEDYHSPDLELAKLRLKFQNLWLKFNQSGEQEILKELFEQEMETVHINPPFYCDYGYPVKFGKNVFVNYNCTFLTPGGIEIGDNCWIGPDVKLYTAIHPIDSQKRNTGIGSAKPIEIGANCWLGGNVTIVPGVKIGNGSVIGAGSVVTKDIPENCIAAGNPCKVLRYIEK